MTPPRVALVLATSTGGVGVHVRSLAEHMVAAGWPVTVCGPAPTEELFGFAAVGARFCAVPLSGVGSEASAAWHLRRASRDAALVHAHGLRAGLAAALARRRPLVVTWHNAVLDTGVQARITAIGERVVARSATVTLGASADLVERVRGLGGRDVRLAEVAPPAPVVSHGGAATRHALGVGAEQPLVVCVSRLHPQKALDVLVRAALDWRDLPGTPAVVVAGDGPLRTQLQALIDELGAPVTLLGRRGDVPDLLAAADLAVLPSLWEARPLAVQEAMLLGTAVVATDVGGVRDLVGDTAVLVAPGDVRALSAAVAGLLADPAARRDLAVRALERASSWPDADATSARIVGVYRGVLGLDG